MVVLLAIDPGNELSSFVLYNEEARLPVTWGEHENWKMLSVIEGASADQLAIEMVQSFGAAVGQTMFDTCVWVGRFAERWYLTDGTDAQLIFRKDVKYHHCHNIRAKDPEVRQAVLDRWGGKAKAVGLKANPGPLYGIKSHCWQALALAITAAERPQQLELREGG